MKGEMKFNVVMTLAWFTIAAAVLIAAWVPIEPSLRVVLSVPEAKEMADVECYLRQR